MIENYVVIKAPSAVALCAEVDALIARGKWQPQGGISILSFMGFDGNGGEERQIWYFQAMVK